MEALPGPGPVQVEQKKKVASKQKQALKWLVGLRKLRSSKKVEILQVILVLQVES